MLKVAAALVGAGLLVVLCVFAIPFLNPEVHKEAAGYKGLRFLSATAQAGYSPYVASCAECHGFSGEGTDRGPDLLSNKIATDFRDRPAFHRAIKRGVAAHQALLSGQSAFNQVELMGKFLREVRARERRNRD